MVSNGKDNWEKTIKSSTRNKTLPAQPRGAKNQMPYYWIFPLGLLSGLRTNEMCQLRCYDVRKENRIWMIYVEDTKDTNVKSDASIRKVPVHPQLINLGFIEYNAKQIGKEKENNILGTNEIKGWIY